MIKRLHLAILGCAAAALLQTSLAFAQQPFQLSSKFLEATFYGNKVWDGQHHFAKVLCLTFPRPGDAQAFAEALYNNNAIYYSRAAYNDLTALYVVSSTIPAGRSSEEEISNLEAQHKKAIDAYPRTFSQSKATGELGPSLSLTVRNAKEGSKEVPFPLTRTIDRRPDAPLTSLSVHRLFVHGHDRIEVAGLRYFKIPVEPEQEAAATADLSALVEQASQSLQSCTAKLPPRM
ncbi:hypothetical protein [Noviherbaspirillum autotrophicum]|uniref:Uncharacterized protein n=1 Tax=Noviherbaspirillum autotrophicum TaxID=709839 RepID=A0A0C1Y8P4_9BURK|nr:hypothetical protein [Noviherbaspirillum autotrophicum]KIF83308.1 hypothetical protein TSA66_24700 [Noviherbaspirillum autotrophicum]